MKTASLVTGIVATASVAVAVVSNTTCKGLVDSNKLQGAITIDALMAKAEELEAIAYSTPDRNREYQSEGFEKTLEWVMNTLEEGAPGYYDIELQPTVFQMPMDPAPLVVNGVAYNSSSMEGDDAIPTGTFTGVPIVSVANYGCDDADYTDATGAMTLILRGVCNFSEKSRLSALHGAVAAIVYNNETQTTLITGTLGSEENVVPTTLILNPDGVAILALIAAGETISADLTIAIVDVPSHNVIATTKGGDHNNVLMLGGHADSVEAGPGINDDGSGSIGILEVALQLSKFQIKNAVRFAWWSGEEAGLLGSTYYSQNVSTEILNKIRLYMNFDMIASPNYVFGIYDGDGSAYNVSGPPGSDAVEKLWEDWFASQGLSSDPSEFDGRSDYSGFLDAGIPSGGLDAGADGVKTEEQVLKYGGTANITYDPNYHSALDNVANLNETCFLTLTKGIAHGVGTYARSWEGFPERNVTSAVTKRWKESREAKRGRTNGSIRYRGNLKRWLH